MNGIHFYKVLWRLPSGAYDETTEAATSRRWLTDHIRMKDVFHPNGDGAAVIKIQKVETPVIDFDYVVKAFETGCTKLERKEHAQEAAYVLNLIEKLAARVKYRKERGEGEVEEVLVER